MPELLSPKAYRAQQTRWRFLSVRTSDNDFHAIEMKNRSEAELFALWLVSNTRCKVDLMDKNMVDGGTGWISKDWAR